MLRCENFTTIMYHLRDYYFRYFVSKVSEISGADNVEMSCIIYDVSDLCETVLAASSAAVSIELGSRTARNCVVNIELAQ